MSSAMVHLSCAKEYDFNGSTLFYTGNIAPDLLSTREAKDVTHFRNIPPERRMDALLHFAETLCPDDPFHKGILMHLFLDLHWDREGYEPYRRAHDREEGWFYRYRQEIFLASAYLYHHTPWAKELFLEMNRTFLPAKESVCGITREGLQAFVAGTWYRLLNGTRAESVAFSPCFVKEFVTFTKGEFVKTFG
jgi:hypothetical protein